MAKKKVSKKKGVKSVMTIKNKDSKPVKYAISIVQRKDDKVLHTFRCLKSELTKFRVAIYRTCRVLGADVSICIERL